MSLQKLFSVCQPLIAYVPDISPPPRTILFRHRLVWTASIVSIYLVMSQIPLYGAYGRGADPYFHHRLILGSNRGTIMELGLSPLLSAGVVMQLLSTSRTFDVSLFYLKWLQEIWFNSLATQQLGPDRTKRVSKDSIEKAMSLCLCFALAVFYVCSGIYGPIKTIGLGNAILVVVQVSVIVLTRTVTTFQCIVIILNIALWGQHGSGSFQ